MSVKEKLKADLRALGIQRGDSVMMHCSYKSLGEKLAPQDFFCAFVEVLGEEGTLILPAFSYRTVTYENPIFDRAETPSCVGFLPEYFRTEFPDVTRSLHATHSCSVWGKNTAFLIEDHQKDLTPVGENSPITRLVQIGGKILILGSHPDHNTILHGVEEAGGAPYIFDRSQTIPYVLRDGERQINQNALRHNFQKADCHYEQKYARILELLSEDDYTFGKVLHADCYLMSARAIWDKGVKKVKEAPYFFVNRVRNP